MFLLNLGYSWAAADAVPVSGCVHLACANYCTRFLRTQPPLMNRVLFDPQIYLSSLDVSDCNSACARLATYPWFGYDIPEFISGTMSQNEWKDVVKAWVPSAWNSNAPSDIVPSCRAAMEFQVNLGCSQLILPSPMIEEREDQGQVLGEWIDAALAASNDIDVGQPLLATIALHEQVLNEQAFEEGGYLDGIIDQVTARAGISGVYVVVAQTKKDHPFRKPSTVNRAYLHLCTRAHDAGCEFIVTNYADLFGLVCMAIGATAFASGDSHSRRRLCMSMFDDDQFGKAYPYFYSHRMAAELASETDLDPILAKNLLSRVRDNTPYSAELMNRLAQGGSASDLVAWAENVNNTQAAQRHYIARLNERASDLGPRDSDDRVEIVRNWLELAAARQTYVLNRIPNLSGARAPVDMWLENLEAYVTA